MRARLVEKAAEMRAHCFEAMKELPDDFPSLMIYKGMTAKKIAFIRRKLSCLMTQMEELVEYLDEDRLAAERHVFEKQKTLKELAAELGVKPMDNPEAFIGSMPDIETADNQKIDIWAIIKEYGFRIDRLERGMAKFRTEKNLRDEKDEKQERVKPDRMDHFDKGAAF